jgi:F-type H+-transporting ATPase subunit b
MRIRTLLAAGLLALVAVVSLPHAASAADPGTSDGQALVTCVQKALKDNQAEIAKKQYTNFTNALNDCNKAPSLFAPAASELIWGTIAFIIVAFALMKYAFPALRKTLHARTEKIRGDLEGAERAREEAEEQRRQYEAKLGEARSEATRIVESAHQDAERLRQELMARAEADAAEARARAQDDIRLATDRAMGDLRTRVAGLSIDLAERIVERSLDRETQQALVESYIDAVGTSGNGHG